MAIYSGRAGKITIDCGGGARDLLHMTGWRVHVEKKLTQTACLGGISGDEGFFNTVPGAIRWVGMCEGYADLDADGAQQMTARALLGSDRVECGFFLDELTCLCGAGYIESFDIKSRADGRATIAVQLCGSGAIKIGDVQGGASGG